MTGPVTTYTNPASRPFAWSYSKLKNFEACPKRHFHYDIAKDVKEPESDQLAYGNLVHKELARAISERKPMLSSMAEFEPWVNKIVTGPGNILVEQQLAIRRDFSPCDWFKDKTVWYRGIADVVKLNDPVALVIDWKTGKIVEDSVQLMLMAQCVFSHHPTIQAIRAEFVWLAHDATTKQIFKRADMPGHWASVIPRANMLEQANITMTYPAKPGYLCKRWCAVETCPHHGE